MRKEIWAIILAAGKGTRLQDFVGGQAKQFLTYSGAPLFWHSAKTFSRVPRIDGILFMFPPDRLSEASELVEKLHAGSPLGLPYICAAGGLERQDSVWNALKTLPSRCTQVLVHDSARPFASPALSIKLLEALEQGYKGVIPGLAPSDTVKEADDDGLARITLQRSKLRLIQTPQAFDREALETAHKKGQEKALAVTDDAALLEAAGIPVLIIDGEAANQKITRPEDLIMLQNNESGRQAQAWPCNGLGYDVHKYGGNRPLRLGGVAIENGNFSVKAHSDGDVLLHALMDALLGCASAGDIGKLFPDSNPDFEGVDSAVLLSEVLELVTRQGIVLSHADITIIAEAPKIAPYREEIAKNIAKLLHLKEQQVNLKSTTEEGLGFTGAKEGIKAMVLVSAMRSNNF